MSLLAVRRPLAPVDHQQLRNHLREVNHRLSDISMIWRPMGQAALFLISPSEYLRVISQKKGQLYERDPSALVDDINARVPGLPTEGEKYMASVRKVDFHGRGRILHVACFLYPDELGAEQDRMRTIIDKANGSTGYWGDEPFEPYVSLATIEAVHAETRVLDLFDEFVPDELNLNRVQAAVAK
jgi:hypothetical protein